MAEALLRRAAGERFEAFSAGLDPVEIDPRTRAVMAEIGLDLHGQHAESVDTYLGKMHIGHLITVCDAADRRCPSVFPGMGIRLHGSFADPAAFRGTPEEELAEFRKTRDLIAAKIGEWLASLPEPDPAS